MIKVNFMKSKFRVVSFLIFALLNFNLAVSADEAGSPRERLPLDFGWKFFLGNPWGDVVNLTKAANDEGPVKPDFLDAGWRTVNLPHDWAVELPFDRNADADHGYKPVGPGYPQNNIGWYRRTFELLEKEDSGKRLWLEFDGVYRNCDVFVNGWFIGHHDSGYESFRYNITDVANCGGKNVITVKVDASKFEGWFYEGAGIYRHVWLEKSAQVAIAPDGIFVHTEFNDNVPQGPATVCIETRILNPPTNSADINITHELFDPNGKSLTKTFPMMRLPISPFQRPISKQQEDFRQMIVLRPNFHAENMRGVPGNPLQMATPLRLLMPKLDFAGRMFPAAEIPTDIELWSPESPKLYKLITTVEVSGQNC